MRKHLVKKVVETMFGFDKLIEGIGIAAAANASFNEKVMEAVQDHIQKPINCYYHHCHSQFLQLKVTIRSWSKFVRWKRAGLAQGSCYW
jgi:isocitrate dehydrogenase kinase/phosphatase